MYVDALLRRVRRTPSNESQREEVSKDYYFVMRLSTSPRSENTHHFRGFRGGGGGGGGGVKLKCLM